VDDTLYVAALEHRFDSLARWILFLGVRFIRHAECFIERGVYHICVSLLEFHGPERFLAIHRYTMATLLDLPNLPLQKIVQQVEGEGLPGETQRLSALFAS
jgi:hypothetical protein